VGQKYAENPDTAIPRAIEVFARGFCFTRSITHPYIPEQIDGLWVVRDAPRRHGTYRNEEWIAWRTPPADVDRIARQHTRGRFAVCVLCAADESDAPLRQGYRELNYRLGRTEPLMIHTLQKIPRCQSPARIERVRTPELAERLAKVQRMRPLKPEFLAADSPLREYAALIDDHPIGWVRSVSIGNATWCSSMYVKPPHRRQGIARALLCQMLRDDRAAGAQSAVLLASHVGAKLYPVVGYHHLATLLLYTPKRR